MKLGKDFWLIMKIITAIIKVLVAILGDDDDVREGKANGF